MEKIMLRNLDSDSDTKERHMCSGREFREVHLPNLFKQNYGEGSFYSGEEADLTDEDQSEPVREKEGKAKEPHREEPEASGTTKTIEVSTIIHPIDSVALSNQINPSHQSVKRTVTISPPHTQSGTLGRSMEDDMRIPIFRGDGSKDLDKN
jgi:hypothetical protein